MRTIALLFACACASAGADPSAQPIDAAKEVRKVDAFHGIEIAGTLEVEARVDATTRVEVYAEPAELLPRITTTVKDGILVIDTKGKWRGRTRLRAVVSAPRLDRLVISGTGMLHASNLGGSALDASVGGTGSLRLAGNVHTLRLSIPGTGEVRAKELIASAVEVAVDGTGDAAVHATQSVDARIGGTGAIRVHGRPPTIKKTVTGTGVVDVR